MDRYLIFERYIYEQENLIEQLVPRKDWTKPVGKLDADEVIKLVKTGKAREAKFGQPVAPKVDPKNPNLPALLPRQFVGGVKKDLPKAVKYIGAAVLSAAIIALAYKAYKKYKEHAACPNMTPEQKAACLKNNRIKALKKQIEILNNTKIKCKNSNNQESCLKKINDRVSTIEKQIKEAA